MCGMRKKVKRCFAVFLAFCIIFSTSQWSEVRAEWSYSSQEESGTTEENEDSLTENPAEGEILIEIDRERFVEAAEEAVRNGEPFLLSDISFWEMGRNGELTESEEYQKLFDRETGTVFMMEELPVIGTASDAERDYTIDVFVKLDNAERQSASASNADRRRASASDADRRPASTSDADREDVQENYYLTGNETYIFFFTNNSSETLRFQLDVDGKRSGIIQVESGASVVGNRLDASNGEKEEPATASDAEKEEDVLFSDGEEEKRAVSEDLNRGEEEPVTSAALEPEKKDSEPSGALESEKEDSESSEALESEKEDSEPSEALESEKEDSEPSEALESEKKDSEPSGALEPEKEDSEPSGVLESEKEDSELSGVLDTRKEDSASSAALESKKEEGVSSGTSEEEGKRSETIGTEKEESAPFAISDGESEEQTSSRALESEKEESWTDEGVPIPRAELSMRQSFYVADALVPEGNGILTEIYPAAVMSYGISMMELEEDIEDEAVLFAERETPSVMAATTQGATFFADANSVMIDAAKFEMELYDYAGTARNNEEFNKYLLNTGSSLQFGAGSGAYNYYFDSNYGKNNSRLANIYQGIVDREKEINASPTGDILKTKLFNDAAEQDGIIKKYTIPNPEDLFTENNGGYEYDSYTTGIKSDLYNGNRIEKVDDKGYKNPNNTLETKAGVGGFWPFGNGNSFFGMHLKFDFSLLGNGKVSNEDMVFEFRGDDDVWVYLTDLDDDSVKPSKLVLDIGGNHNSMGGKINFATGEITYEIVNKKFGQHLGPAITNLNPVIYGKEGANKAYLYTEEEFIKQYMKNNPGTSEDAAKREFDKKYPLGAVGLEKKDFTRYQLDFYFLDRGGGSNCYLKFNLPIIRTDRISVVKIVETTTESSELKKDQYVFDLYVDDREIEEVTVLTTDGYGMAEFQYEYHSEDGNAAQKPIFYIEEQDSSAEGAIVTWSDSSGMKTGSGKKSMTGTVGEDSIFICTNRYGNLEPTVSKKAVINTGSGAEGFEYDLQLSVRGETKYIGSSEGQIEEYLKDVEVFDTLSKYVELAKVEGAGGKYTIFVALTDSGEENPTFTAVEKGSKSTYEYRDNGNLVVEITDDGVIKWKVTDGEETLKGGEEKTLHVGIKVRSDYGELEENSYPNQADAGTGTYGAKKGYFSNENQKAYVTYKTEDINESGKKFFPKPVVRPFPNYSIILKKEVIDENNILKDKKETYKFQLYRNANQRSDKITNGFAVYQKRWDSKLVERKVNDDGTFEISGETELFILFKSANTDYLKNISVEEVTCGTADKTRWKIVNPGQGESKFTEGKQTDSINVAESNGSDNVKSVIFQNEYLTLTVRKVFDEAGSYVPPDIKFTFKATFRKNEAEQSGISYEIQNKYKNTVQTGNVGKGGLEFHLSKDEQIVFFGIASGTEYTIKETGFSESDSETRYLIETTKVHAENSEDFSEVDSKTIKGIFNSYTTSTHQIVTYKNTMAWKKGTLTIDKKLVDNNKEEYVPTDDPIFLFEIEKTDEPAQGQRFTVSMNVKEKPCGSIMVSDLPLGSYRVTEIDNMRYTCIDGAEKDVEVFGDAWKDRVSFTNQIIQKGYFSDNSINVNTITRDGNGNVGFKQNTNTDSERAETAKNSSVMALPAEEFRLKEEEIEEKRLL